MFSIIGILTPLVIGGIGGYWTYRTHKNDEILRKKDVVLELYDEFDRSESMKYAKAILNYRVIEPDANWIKCVLNYNIVWHEIRGDYRPLKELLKNEFGVGWVETEEFTHSPENIVTIHNQQKFVSITLDEKTLCCSPRDTTINKDKYYFCATTSSDGIMNRLWYFYHISNLQSIMRLLNDDNPIIDEGEHTIRNSFDALLDFFSRLSYLSKIGLIKKNELSYFSYYIDKILDGKNKALLGYAIEYGYAKDWENFKTIARPKDWENFKTIESQFQVKKQHT